MTSLPEETPTTTDGCQSAVTQTYRLGSNPGCESEACQFSLCLHSSQNNPSARRYENAIEAFGYSKSCIQLGRAWEVGCRWRLRFKCEDVSRVSSAPAAFLVRPVCITLESPLRRYGERTQKE